PNTGEAGSAGLRANMIFMIAEPMQNPRTPAPSALLRGPAGQQRGTRNPACASPRTGRPWARTLAAGAIAVMAAFVTVQVGGCGFKTPLQLPKKAPPPKPAS
ncbi:MAG: hypothetical protein K2W80_04615, partial [Burkholderiales bacterium]|nr:hypothetical protein [Burkholderiales bacterium]